MRRILLSLPFLLLLLAPAANADRDDDSDSATMGHREASQAQQRAFKLPIRNSFNKLLIARITQNAADHRLTHHRVPSIRRSLSDFSPRIARHGKLVTTECFSTSAIFVDY
jgi:hypothetical protein